MGMPTLGSYNVHVDMSPNDTPIESVEKLIEAANQAKAQVDENKRRAEAEAARKKQSFLGRLFG